jgi:hypothetical protein
MKKKTYLSRIFFPINLNTTWLKINFKDRFLVKTLKSKFSFHVELKYKQLKIFSNVCIDIRRTILWDWKTKQVELFFLFIFFSITFVFFNSSIVLSFYYPPISYFDLLEFFYLKVFAVSRVFIYVSLMFWFSSLFLKTP